MVPYMGLIDENFTAMQDNAQPHAAAQVQQYREEVFQRLHTMNCPTLNLDLNPIEYVWDSLEKAVYSRNPVPTTVAALRTAIFDLNQIYAN